MINNPLYVLAFLCFNIVLCEWLCKKTQLRHLGTSLLVIVITAVVANVGLIPTASNAIPLYDGIFHYVAPVSIFFLLLNVNLDHLKKAGLPMLVMFIVASMGTVLGVFIGIYFVDGQETLGEHFHVLAGMMTGTYVGGSANFNAVALHYGMTKNGAIYAGTAAVDSIYTTIWMIISIVIPKYLYKIMPRKTPSKKYQVNDKEVNEHSDNEKMSPWDFGILLTLACASLWISNLLASYLSSIGISIPSMLILTTMALVLAQLKMIQKLNGSRLLGIFLVYIFLAVIGAYCEIGALASIGDLAITLMIFIGLIVLVHGLFVFIVGGLFKQDWDLIAVASQASIGGGSTALALAKSLNRNDLLLPGVLVGSLGTGLGTYYGFLVAAWLAP